MNFVRDSQLFINIECIISKFMASKIVKVVQYRHGQPNPDSHSIMRVRHRLPMSVNYYKGVSAGITFLAPDLLMPK